MNASYFSSVFKIETGKNFIDFLIEIRINEAKKFLARPELKVYEVGSLVGYSETASFIRVFKKVVGISPAEYRRAIS
jgi:two-component system response regulator YesN